MNMNNNCTSCSAHFISFRYQVSTYICTYALMYVRTFELWMQDQDSLSATKECNLPTKPSVYLMYVHTYVNGWHVKLLLCPTAGRGAKGREPSYPAWYTQTTCSAYIRSSFPFALLHLLLTAPTVSKLDH